MKSTNKNNGASLEQYVIRIEEEIFDAEKVAEILNSSKKVIERELREGKMTGYKRLNKWFVLKSDLVKYIREAEAE
ncbi:MAG: helix-turn-helix domain-containing protein [Lewinellaceae bacterium]|nr:helix-turn-helix domain-containing protein [Lewinellaceae bacterium]